MSIKNTQNICLKGIPWAYTLAMFIIHQCSSMYDKNQAETY